MNQRRIPINPERKILDQSLSSRHDTETTKVLVPENSSRASPGAQEKEELVNFNTRVDRVSQESGPERSRWTKSSFEEAENNYRKYSMQEWDMANRRYKNIGFCCNNRKLVQFGTGVYLFFSWVKQLTIVFGVMSVFAGVSIYCTYTSKYLKQAEVTSPFDYTTIANLATFRTQQPDGTFTTYSTEEIVELENKRVIVYFMDVLLSLTFLIFLMVYRCRLKREIKNCDKEIVTISDYSVEIKDIKPDTTEADVERLARRYGKIVEVKIARNYKQTFEVYKSIADLELSERMVFALLENFDTDKKERTKKMDSLRKDIIEKKKKAVKILKSKNLKIKEHKDFPASRAYVIFEHTEARNEMLMEFQKEIRKRRLIHFCCCDNSKPEERFMIRNKPVTVEIPEEPSNIRFENLGASTWQRFSRRLMTFVLIILVLIVALVLMYILSQVQGYQPSIDCKTVYTLEEINTNETLSNNRETIYCYCSKQNTQDILQGTGLVYCKEYLIDRSYRQAVNFGISVLEVIAGAIIRSVIEKLSEHLLFTKVSKELTTTSYMIFYSDIINFSIITILMKGDFYSFRPSKTVEQLLQKISPSLVKNANVHSSFNTAWYIDIGGKILSRFILYVFLPYFLWIFYYPISMCFTRIKAKRAKIQEEANQLMVGRPFSMANIGSKVLSQVFLCFMWCAGLPVLVVLTFLGLFVCYLIIKWGAVNYFRRPDQIDENFVVYTAKFMPLCLVFHSIFSIIIYNTSEVFNLPERNALPQNIQNNLGFLSKFDYRQHWMYYGIGSISAVLFVWDFLIVELLKLFFIWDFLKNKVVKAKSEVEEELEENQLKKSSNPSFTETKKKLSYTAVSSYDIRKNSKYRDVIMAMDFEIIEEDAQTVLYHRASTLNVRRQFNPNGPKTPITIQPQRQNPQIARPQANRVMPMNQRGGSGMANRGNGAQRGGSQFQGNLIQPGRGGLQQGRGGLTVSRGARGGRVPQMMDRPTTLLSPQMQPAPAMRGRQANFRGRGF